ncbi:MAG: large repetitive protein, partial [Acidobacteriota bacterium]|nr:large repetitive protein [Acidobacteriota bacterium]
MKTFRQRKQWLALLAIMFVFAACKGDSPTAPNPGTGNPPGGSPPPTGVTVTVTSSNATPLVDSTTIITATVTNNGQPVPNGTAVEFQTSLGLFTDAEAPSTIRTTTNGVATVTLTSSTVGAATVRVTVNNVSRTVGVTFRARPTEEPQPSTAPTITSVSPALGRPAGGEVIRINGTNFKTPVRVLFNTGGATPKEAFVVSVSPTVIEVITPSVDLGAGQQLESQVTVITEAGTATERSITAPAPFIFRADVLTPRITTASPNSGPINGGTRVTLFGDGFQAPVQVLFGSAEARVIDVKFDQIIVLAPPGRDTSADGSGAVTGPVDVTVVNINSATRATSTGAFRYAPKAVITAAGPTIGPSSGGTRVTIDGSGFDDPVAVVIGGVGAQPIFVSGTRIIAITSAVRIVGCADVTGPIEVVNIENGDGATGPDFTYVAQKPTIIGINPQTIAAGGTVQVTVLNAPPGANKFQFGTKTAFPSSAIANADGTTVFSVAVPLNFTFETEACIQGGVTGERQVPLDVDVIFTNLETDCTDTATDGLRVNPADLSCVLPPPPEVTLTSP